MTNKVCSRQHKYKIKTILPFRLSTRKERSQSSALKLRLSAKKQLFQCIAVLFSPSLSVHAIVGQQSATAIHFLAHIWHYRQPIKKPEWTNAIPYGQTLAFLFLGFGDKGRAKQATIPFLAEARQALARAQLPSIPTR